MEDDDSVGYITEGLNSLSVKTAKKTMTSLVYYLKVKGIYLLAKIRPEESPFHNKSNIEFLLNYMNRFTDLRKSKFWSKLSQPKQEKVIQFLQLREEETMQLTLNYVKKTADIYVILSGTIKDGPAGLKLPHGSLFGSIDIFNEVPPVDPDDTPLVTVNLIKATVLRLRYVDYHHIVYGEVREAKFRLREMLSAEEKVCVDICDLAEEKLSLELNTFLTHHNLLPQFPIDTCYKYVSNGTMNRTLVIEPKKPKIIIILEGAMRISVTCRDEESGVLSYSQKGRKGIQINQNKMPLVVLEDGAIFLINETMFQALEENGDTTNPLDTFNAQINSQLGTNNVKIENNLVAQFARNTVYLAIPFKKFRNCLNMATHKVFLEIQAEMQHIIDTIMHRTQRILPWYCGTLAWEEVQETQLAGAQQEYIQSPLNPIGKNYEHNKSETFGAFTNRIMQLKESLGSLGPEEPEML